MQDNVERIKHHAVTSPDLAGSRLDLAVSKIFSEYSRARLQKWIRSGELTVNGKSSKTTYRVIGAETIEIDAEPEHEDRILPQNIPLAIMHADKDLLIINKPAGLVVHPAVGNRDGTLQNGLLYFDPALAAIPRSGIVHRLDKNTSGVMVVARSLRAHKSLVSQLQDRSMGRKYEAVARGELLRAGTIDKPIGRHPKDRKRMAVVSSGRPAVTHYRPIRVFPGLTHLQVSLQTGRTHQIRVHMSFLGFPLVGDVTYGRRFKQIKGMAPALIAALQQFPRQALHARTLHLQHPESERQMEFSADLPRDMLSLLALLGEH